MNEVYFTFYNAVAHRNYFISGSQIEINMFKDRLEITSPGALLGVREIEKETRISSIIPRRRNEVICSPRVKSTSFCKFRVLFSLNNSENLKARLPNGNLSKLKAAESCKAEGIKRRPFPAGPMCE